MMATAATWEAGEELIEGNTPDVLLNMIKGAGTGALLYGGTGALASSVFGPLGTVAGGVL